MYISLRIAGVYRKYSVRRSQLSRHDFMTMGYVSPHLLSSVSDCVSAVSLLTAPYTVLRSQRELLLMLTADVFYRVAYLMDNTEVGHLYWGIRSVWHQGSLSDRQHSISVYPGHLCSEDRLGPLTGLAPSLLEIYIPRSSLWPPLLIPKTL